MAIKIEEGLEKVTAGTDTDITITDDVCPNCGSTLIVKDPTVWSHYFTIMHCFCEFFHNEWSVTIIDNGKKTNM